MSSISEWFALGGPALWAISSLDICASLIGFVALVLAFLSRFANKGATAARVFVTLALMAAVIPACAGLGGQWWAERAVDAAILNASVDSKQALLEEGYAQAAIPRNAGCGSTCCLLIPALLAMLVAPTKKRDWVDEFDDAQA